ncbi:probably inactive leucine-rich repeat receptor-like protein kinase At3g28040 [Prunus avium]|uniref:Probably inactive leucine-rich repeat receptor-like protein kinase At3g28040 n=1 Tax=Prunus avium TaxID=42229 RepID=A0A6P5TRD8_PRUAV|nr:probably inactive leucine-rich repeat receptor-like protein kinase At3g28040 [Prunus avium]
MDTLYSNLFKPRYISHFFLLLFLASSYLHTHVRSCIEEERSALLSFKQDLKDPSGRLSSWVSLDCCQWEGISYTNHTGQVAKLNLRNPYPYLIYEYDDLMNEDLAWDQLAYKQSCLGGKINPSLLSLKYLNYLDLSYNDFDGIHIPKFFGELKSLSWLFNLTSLRELDLSVNYFRGPFPGKLASLKSLEYLDLSNLGLEGQFSKVIGNLCKLKMLSLRGNHFPGEGIEEFLRCLSNCPNNTIVESLDFSYCSLEGQLPASLGMLTTLQHINLEVNHFWGSIPKSIGNLSSLKTMDLSNNHMNGSISESLGKPSELVKLDLRENPWKDILTEAHLINLTRLKYLSIYSDDMENPMSLIFNMAYDWVPHFKLHTIEIVNCPIGPGFGLWLQSQTELSSVTLRNTSISDSIPEEWFLKISSQLQYLDLSYNQIFGKLPFHLKFPHISDINLGHNQFDGPLPLWTTSASSFDLGNNLFSGPIPSNFNQEMPTLRKLVLSGNRLNGTLPPSICNIEYLKLVSLSNNQLCGQVPQEWSLCSGLEVIDVAHNNLSGNILSSLGNQTSLQVLKVNNNNFGGEIPFSLQHCTSLKILHLGGNKFIGKLPFWIGSNVSTLQLLSLQSNLLSGHLPHQFCNLPYLHVLDLGHNKFSGTIPKCLKNMTSLAQADAEKYFPDDIIYYDYGSYARTTITSKGKELEYGDVKLIQWETSLIFRQTILKVKSLNKWAVSFN